MIKHKIRKVPDSVCEKCTQLWEGECRAFEVPHSRAERTSRHRGGVPRRLPCAGYVKPKALDPFDCWTIVVLVLALLVVGALIGIP